MKKSLLLLLLLISSLTIAQEKSSSDYMLGDEEKLEMIVHIWGEVKSPGEYRVPYDTNMLELISLAGGPTEFGKLSKVRLTRESKGWTLTEEGLKALVSEARSGVMTEERLEILLDTHFAKRVLYYDLSDYLEKSKGSQAPPILQPGDVVYVSRNNWYRWKEIVGVASQIAIILSVYVWYLRAIEDDGNS